MKTALVIVVTSLVFILGVWWGYPLLRNDIDSYDAKFHACMEIRKSWLPLSYRTDYRAVDFRQMMTDCEREANR